MNLPCTRSFSPHPRAAAFTLIEVMIAVTIFFMAMFSILGVLSASLHAASILRSNSPSPAMVAGQLSLTNKLSEGSDSGNFGEIDEYKNYRWFSQTRMAATNGLFQVDIQVINPGGRLDSSLSVLFYRPDSQQGHMGLH
jgi:Tfp pilus assembly protein PilV